MRTPINPRVNQTMRAGESERDYFTRLAREAQQQRRAERRRALVSRIVRRERRAA